VAPGALEATFEYRVRPGSLLSVTNDEGTVNALLARIRARHAALYVEQLPALVEAAVGGAPPQARSMLVGAARETVRAVHEAGEALREARDALAQTREALRREREAARQLADSLRDAREASRRHEALAADRAATVAEILSSTSWRVSAPVRWVGRLVRRLRRRGRSARRQG
jgi:Sec-independent protein translocase protein TatA